MNVSDLKDHLDHLISLPHNNLQKQPTAKIVCCTKVTKIDLDENSALVEAETANDIKRFESSYLVSYESASS